MFRHWQKGPPYFMPVLKVVYCNEKDFKVTINGNMFGSFLEEL